VNKMEATHLNWGFPVALDLFLAGMGAGAFMLAVMAQLANDKKYRAINITGALIAPWPAILGVALLVIDLGKPFRFWEMILRRVGPTKLAPEIFMFNPLSTMSIGTWLMTAFVIGSLVYLVVVTCTIPASWGKIARGVTGIVLLPIALGVTIYTGVLIAATANPLWNNAVLPMVFVASAMASGIALVVFLVALFQIVKTKFEKDSAVPSLVKATGGILAFQLVAMVIYMVIGVKADAGAMKALLSITSGYGILWWVGIVGLGLIVPLAFSVNRKACTPQTCLVMSALILAGGFFMRYAILFAGQM
jgi:polysulfide reductase chain C